MSLADGVVVVDDCYNANPMSMRAALDDLAASAPGRRVAVLGDMLELGADEQAFHEQVGAHAAAAGVDVLLAVGARATAEAFAPRRRRRRSTTCPTPRRPPRPRRVLVRPATPCWSRPRAAWRSRPSPPRCGSRPARRADA